MYWTINLYIKEEISERMGNDFSFSGLFYSSMCVCILYTAISAVDNAGCFCVKHHLAAVVHSGLRNG
jgi:hypothetical protein